MCLGIPGRIIAVKENGPALLSAIVEFAGIRREVCLACVPESQPGDYVIVHAGIAISRVDPEEAARVLAIIDAIADQDGWDTPLASSDNLT